MVVPGENCLRAYHLHTLVAQLLDLPLLHTLQRSLIDRLLVADEASLGLLKTFTWRYLRTRQKHVLEETCDRKFSATVSEKKKTVEAAKIANGDTYHFRKQEPVAAAAEKPLRMMARETVEPEQTTVWLAARQQLRMMQQEAWRTV